MQDLWHYIKPYRGRLVIMFIALTTSSSMVLGFGSGVGYLIDNGFSKNNIALLNQALAILILVIVLLAIATFIRAKFIYSICEHVIADIRNDIFKIIIHLSPEYFEINKASKVSVCLTNDTTILNSIIANVASTSIRNSLMMIGSFILLIITSPKLTACILLILPIIVVPIIFLGRKVRVLSRKTQDTTEDLGSHVIETLDNIRIVQSYTNEPTELKNFSKRVDSIFKVSTAYTSLRAFFIAFIIFTVFTAIAFVLWIGGHDVINQIMTPGQLSSFVIYAIILASSIGSLSEVFSDIQKAKTALDRLFELLNEKPTIHDAAKTTDLPKNTPGKITFNKVNFHYPLRKDSQALNKVSFQINPGEVLAIVGPSGSGKTTIFNLLMRFYDPISGNINIDSIDVKHLKLSELRNLYSYVSQEPVIFSSTAFDNIAYGHPNATYEMVVKAAKMAEAFEFIDKLPLKFDSFLGEKGIQLSGGQRQRIAIARAILRNAPILLLDEATSSLDNKNERLVQQALTNLMKDRTTIIIAHRLSTIEKADRIIIIKNGMIDSIGTHSELIAKKGWYYENFVPLQLHYVDS